MSTKPAMPDLPLFSANGNHNNMKKQLLKTPSRPKNYLTPLGEKIFLDRYIHAEVFIHRSVHRSHPTLTKDFHNAISLM